MYWINLILPAIILLPNLIYFWVSPSGSKNEWEKEHPLLLTVLEWIGRAGVIITPIFNPLNIESVGEDMAILVVIVFLIIYYLGWIRYFAREMDSKYLYSPLMGIPLPLAISPVFFFLFISYPLHSVALFISTILFGVSHIWIALRQYRQYIEEVQEQDGQDNTDNNI
jgi:hypothetical protein